MIDHLLYRISLENTTLTLGELTWIKNYLKDYS